MKTRPEHAVPHSGAKTFPAFSGNDVSFHDDELLRLELLVARRADELVRLSGSQINRNSECWVQAEAEMRRMFFGSLCPTSFVAEGSRVSTAG
jgi:hypothetical protein